MLGIQIFEYVVNVEWLFLTLNLALQKYRMKTGALGSKKKQNRRADVPATPEQMFNPLVHTYEHESHKFHNNFSYIEEIINTTKLLDKRQYKIKLNLIIIKKQFMLYNWNCILIIYLGSKNVVNLFIFLLAQVLYVFCNLELCNST